MTEYDASHEYDVWFNPDTGERMVVCSCKWESGGHMSREEATGAGDRHVKSKQRQVCTGPYFCPACEAEGLRLSPGAEVHG